VLPCVGHLLTISLILFCGEKNSPFCYFEKNAVATWSGDFYFYFFCKSGEFGFFFPVKNPLYKSKSYFSGRNLAKFLQNKKNHLAYLPTYVPGDEKKNRELMDEETLGNPVLIIHGGAIWPC
jgi:hypothetical protein